MAAFFRIRTSKFPILEGEDEEIVNPGTYGKSFAQYIQACLAEAGYEVPFICCEDWGWWVEVCLPQKSIGILCYRAHDENTECDFLCSTSPESDRMWSWSKFRRIDIGEDLRRLHADLIGIFERDPDITYVGETDEFPFGPEDDGDD